MGFNQCPTYSMGATAPGYEQSRVNDERSRAELVKTEEGSRAYTD